MSVLLYRDIFSVCAQVIAWVTECSVFNINILDAVLSECACFIFAGCVLPLFVRFLFSSLVGVLARVKR